MIWILDNNSRYSYENRFVTVTLPDDPAPDSFVALDVETATSDMHICQVGIARVEGGRIVEKRSILVQPPNNEYDYFCVRVHGIVPEKTASMPTFPTVWESLAPILHHAVIVCHNASFDMSALGKEMDYYGLGDLEVKSVICTCTELGRMDLFSCCKRFDITLERHHDAASDAEATANLLLAYSAHRGETVTIWKEKENKIPIAKILRDTRENAAKDSDSPVFGKTVVITGVFESFERDELAIRLSSLGAKVTGAVSKNTDYLIAGLHPGESKMSKAHALSSSGGKIQIITEDELISLLETKS